MMSKVMTRLGEEEEMTNSSVATSSGGGGTDFFFGGRAGRKLEVGQHSTPDGGRERGIHNLILFPLEILFFSEGTGKVGVAISRHRGGGGREDEGAGQLTNRNSHATKHEPIPATAEHMAISFSTPQNFPRK